MADWNALLDEHGPMVAGISWRILSNATDVEDNVQETFIQAFRLEQAEPIRHWRGLLRRLATLGALARRRRRKLDASLDGVSLFSGGGSPDELAITRELEERLRDAVARLPKREGAVFSLRYFEQLTLDEIAKSLTISYSAAGAALSRARGKLEPIFRDIAVEEK